MESKQFKTKKSRETQRVYSRSLITQTLSLPITVIGKTLTELGQMYAQGLGTIQRFDQAVIWYERAAQQGHARAQFNLAFMVTHGQGVEENLLKAYEWYRISHLCGYSLAKKSMEVTARKLSHGEVEMADWRADSFVHRLGQ